MIASDVIEKTFTFNGFSYAAQYWGNGQGLPIIALHGWLDNSASFSVLAPQLEGAQFLALDLAGHGYTDHRVGLMDYALWSEIPDIFAIADEMGWDRFVLMGHSRGAMLSFLAAGTLPERISHLILIDALAPLPAQHHDAPERLVQSIKDIQFRINRQRSYYPSREAAIQARCNSEFARIRKETAEALALRGLVEKEGGFHWHADGKLWAKSNIALSFEQIESFLSRISANVLVLLGEHGICVPENVPHLIFLEQIEKRLAASIKKLEDGHYPHMESASSQVAQIIQQFIGEC